MAAEYVLAFGSLGSAPGAFNQPEGISVDARGYVYVADTGNDRVQKLDGTGGFIAQAGGFGWGRHQFNRPVDVCVMPDLDVLVADAQNRRVQRFDERLNRVATLQAPAGWDTPWGVLSGVAASRHGEVYLADEENDQILKLDPFGRPDPAFGGIGAVGGRLRDPRGLAVAPDGTIYVCDSGNSRIVQLDAFGDVMGTFGEGVLSSPSGIAVSGAGQVFVADAERHQVLVFGLEHSLVHQIGVEGSGPGAFRAPRDLAFDPAGFLYVLDSGNARVQKFRIQGAP